MTRLGHVQRRILAALRDGALLMHHDGKRWYLVYHGRRERLLSDSARLLWERGYLAEVGREEGAAWRVRYTVAEQHKEA